MPMYYVCSIVIIYKEDTILVSYTVSHIVYYVCSMLSYITRPLVTAVI